MKRRVSNNHRFIQIRDICFILGFTAYLSVFGYQIAHQPKGFKIISPIPQAEAKEITHRIDFLTVTPTPQYHYTGDNETIYSLIKQTFGVYTDTAMQLLSCENSSLNPEAINTTGNYPEGSQDIGVFQINNYWNDIGNVELLKDPRVNIAVAYHKFVASGYSFNQWTCGRKLGL